MEIEYGECEGEGTARFLDRTGEPVLLEIVGNDLNINTWNDGVTTFAWLDAPRVDALIALLQRWRATGELRPEGEGA